MVSIAKRVTSLHTGVTHDLMTRRRGEKSSLTQAVNASFVVLTNLSTSLKTFCASVCERKQYQLFYQVIPRQGLCRHGMSLPNETLQ